MKNRIVQYILVAVISLTTILGSLLNVSAASFSISASSSNVSAGGTVTVNLSGNGCEGSFKVSVNNGASVVGNSTIWTGESTQVKAGSSNFTITVTPVSVADSNTAEKITNFSAKSISVSVKQPSSGGGLSSSGGSSSSSGGSSSSNSGSSSSSNNTTTKEPEKPKSSDNNLVSLSVSAGELSPAFSADVTEYNVALSGDATSISINASASDSKASVSGTGDKELKVGTNPFVVSVTAENGAVKNYTINVNVDETPTVYTTYNGQNLGVVRNIEGIALPASFEQTTATIDGQEVTAWTSNLMNKTIVYLQNDAGEKNFYLYEDGKGVTSKIVATAILGNNVYIVDLNEEQQKLDGLTYTEVTVDNQTLMGFKFNDEAFSNYSVIYVMNESGEMVYYQYESTQNTLQLYLNGAPISREAYEKLNKDLKDSQKKTMVLLVVAGVGVLTAVASGAYVFMLNKKSKLK